MEHHFAGQESQERVRVLDEEVFDGPETSKQEASSIQALGDSSRVGICHKVQSLSSLRQKQQLQANPAKNSHRQRDSTHPAALQLFSLAEVPLDSRRLGSAAKSTTRKVKLQKALWAWAEVYQSLGIATEVDDDVGRQPEEGLDKSPERQQSVKGDEVPPELKLPAGAEHIFPSLEQAGRQEGRNRVLSGEGKIKMEKKKLALEGKLAFQRQTHERSLKELDLKDRQA
ncbi:hypothetical protein NDU88_006617 [Pleurodeles waltl]|uniref:Uncharacterized protein n=1 Tax=Pleurodeles waltl TaxID=8319 RepID=A0AAV7NR92_PLEWA|nr:hypothetical protein NDU88_006617 [Pleurodeles waltl]